ncbi:RcpC/CpaB family pilus assembly protein [Streptomyces sp. PA5.6]|uniref:RcpC/CpaB family pilus assembly protein n=1 Tax=Streptomyces sp. PA5.6 TaxID=3035651 RepID=UPI003904AA87
MRVRGGHPRLDRLLRHRRRVLAVGLAMTAAALAGTVPRAAVPEETPAPHRVAAAPAADRSAATVTAPVRIADADTVRLLRPGDRIDVIAAGGSPSAGAEPRTVTSGARVTAVPEPGEGPAEAGALVVLSVPRDAAARLAGAGASGPLAVAFR